MRDRTIFLTTLLLSTASLGGCDDNPVDPRDGPDGTAPVVDLLLPAADTTLVTIVGAPERPIITGIATDSVGVVRVTYQIGEAEEQDVVIEPGTSVSFSFRVRLTDGENALVIHAYDAAGNRGSSATRLIRQDRKGPAVELQYPAPNSEIRSDTITLRLRVTDAAGIVAVDVDLGPTEKDFAVAGDTAVVLELVAPVAPGVNQVRTNGRDRHGLLSLEVFRFRRAGIRFSELSVGTDFFCGIGKESAGYCWRTGYERDFAGSSFQLGPYLLAQVALGGTLVCALDAAGSAYCSPLSFSSFRSNDWPELTPLPGGRAFDTVTAGHAHACAIAPNGDVYCWGANDRGQLGTAGGSTTTPAQVSGGQTFTSITAGLTHTCGLTPGDEAYCWGENSSGQLGNGSTVSSGTPARVTGNLRFEAIAGGAEHTCAITAEGEAYCWGSNLLGQLGTGSYQLGSVPTTSPIEVTGGRNFVAIAAGALHTCGLEADGGVYCWGDNVDGQLGTGGRSGSASPVPVIGDESFVAIDAGGVRTCGIAADDRLYCWGESILSPAVVPGSE